MPRRSHLGLSDLWPRHHRFVRVAVVDVGSNTLRLVVAEAGETVCTRREMLALGAAIERDGAVPESKLAEVARCVGAYAAVAHKKGVERGEVLVTSPGRQAANADELVERLVLASGMPVRVLSAEDEAALAFAGAVGTTRGIGRRSVAVCDVGGGSAQVAVGTRRDGIAWTRSIDIGSRRLTSRLLAGDPPGADGVAAAREEVDRLLESFIPPLPQVALAVGGSARAVRTLTGGTLDARALHEAVDLLAATPVQELVDRYKIDVARAPTVAAGAVILAALQQRLRVPLRVARGGLREGALELLAAERSEAA
jgi:exopolyphosphatase/guanosine-5'-triphosphate,3'-diphosphate pyrophosphatase